jgi:hypothetical protein|tara:strand:+ start:234 stop:1067 length:834 start_codon:yes stop_codon:yes gene_type:complete
MFGDHFYHKKIRNTVIAFGTIFNNVNIKRLDSSGNPLQNIKVPLSYSPKEKFLARLDAQQDLTGDDSKVAITLPRMSFEITGYSYDATRKLNKNQKITKVTTNADTTKMNNQYMPVPYNVNFSLNVYTANSDDGLQIIEQILPFFQPDYTVTMIEDTTMDTKRDIPFILNSVDYEDSYTGSLTSLRRIIYTLQFTAKVYLYGPISTSAIIKKVSADLYSDTGSNAPRVERVTVQPNPTSADKDDTYTYTTTLEFFTDTLDYDNTTGEDATSNPTKPS